MVSVPVSDPATLACLLILPSVPVGGLMSPDSDAVCFRGIPRRPSTELEFDRADPYDIPVSEALVRRESRALEKCAVLASEVLKKHFVALAGNTKAGMAP